MIKRKKEASGAIGYVMLFMVVLLIIIITMYLIQVSKLMTHQHHVDDSLTDSVLASLVADDIYYFETYETTGTPVVRFRDIDESYDVFVDCIYDAVQGTQDYYYNFSIDSFIGYEVEGNQVTITTYAGGAKSVREKALGSVVAPTGEVVKETSAYGKVRFDIKSILDGSLVTKTKDIYCTLEINE